MPQIVPIFCENDIVDVEDVEAIDTARANLSRRLMVALRAEKYGDAFHICISTRVSQ